MAASNAQAQGRKIKPINHPSLVLKTPIAYHGGSDLSVLPIDKDGIAVCEKCGAIGVKHTFYTRQRKFCSVTCARSYSGYYSSQKVLDDASYNGNGNIGEDKVEESNYYSKKQVGYKFKLMETSEHLVGMIPMEPLPRLPGMWHPSMETFTQHPPTSHTRPSPHLSSSYHWPDGHLFRCDFLAAPVKLFSHAPLSDMWNNVFEGMKVEVKNTDCDKFSPKLSDYFWVATVLKLKGYMGLLRYEGFGTDESKDFWVNLMNWEVHPVGWCATRGKPLIPPHTIENKYTDWKTFLVRQLTGARTLPTDFYNKIYESLKSRFRLGHILEVVDKNRLSQVKVAIVDDIIEKRLHVRYYDSTAENMSGFWCHEDSPLIHPIGWARSVGHELDAPYDYLQRLAGGISHPDDTTPEMFKTYSDPDPHNIGFQPKFTEGMKLEAIDPLNLSSICQATVMRVLLHGYMMLRIDCYPPDEAGADWFCYHCNSPYIFPAGFCEERGLGLTTAVGLCPPTLPPRSLPLPQLVQHGFVSGMRLECVDLMEPRLVCVATIARVVGRLLKVHFDGWGDEYDQWLDWSSTDIYPVGWCQAVGHKLEGPPSSSLQTTAQPVRRKGGRKKRGGKVQQEMQRLPSESDVSNGNNSNYFDPDTKKGVSIMDLDSGVNGIKQESLFLDTGNDINLMELDVSGIKKDKDTTTNILNTEDTSQMPEYDNIDAGHEEELPQDLDLAFQPDNHEETPQLLPTTSAAHIQESSSAMDVAEDHTVVEEPLPEIKKEKKNIPRLVGNIFTDLNALNCVDPDTWDPEDVAQFLTINDCAPYSLHFSQVSGNKLLQLTKDDIIELLQMKVGPSLKIFDLIQQLKCKLKPAQARFKLYK